MKFSCLEVATAAGLEGRRRGNEQAFPCPRHEDKRPSLMVNPGKDTWLCGPCGQKGTAWQLAAFLAGHDPADKELVKPWLRDRGLLSGNGHRERASKKPTIDRTYSYRKARGALVYESVKFIPKDFKRRRPDGNGGWEWNLKGVQLIPYALDRLVDRTPEVFIPEGEKDCEALWSQQVPATCNIGGSGQWLDTYSEQLKTAAGVERAYILPDHDVPGHRHAQQVAGSLHHVGIEVRVVMLPGLHDGLPAPNHGRDISDWLATHTIEELRSRAAATPVWTPVTEDGSNRGAVSGATSPMPISTPDTRANGEPEHVESATDFPFTDSGNADFFEREAHGCLAYDHRMKRWYTFGPHHWYADTVQRVQERAVQAMRVRQSNATRLHDKEARKPALQWGLKSEDRRRIVDLLALAQSRSTIAVEGSEWDADPMLLGVRNGVLDLERGVLRAGGTTDRITKISPVMYDPHARATRFTRFLKEVFRSAPEIPDWLQRVLGYCLTGLTTEQQFWIWWGTGSNGKSTLLGLLFQAIFGADEFSYAWAMPFPTAHWTTAVTEYQRAELPGRRLVSASEVRRQVPLNEDFIKSLTGGDRVNARSPYGRPFNFLPCCKFVLLCNERPTIRDVTVSMWRRLRLVPFVESFALDTALAGQLAAESAGIMNWLLDGCGEWRRDGLGDAPPVVMAATEQYRQESDVLLEFYAERCVILPGASVGGLDFFTAYRRWCDERHVPDEDRLTQKAFGLRVKERFPDISKNQRRVVYGGIGLCQTEP